MGRLGIASNSGSSVISAGEICTLAISDIGFNVFTFESYPAEIKGGHCWYQVRAANDEVLSAGTAVHCLCAFNQEAMSRLPTSCWGSTGTTPARNSRR